MESETVTLEKDSKLLTVAMILSLVIIFYNLLEGGISVFFGASNETLALFGFGIDSFVEVISGIGITHMVWRMRTRSGEKRDLFEMTALRITGFAFYLLTTGLVFGAAWILYSVSRPETTLAGLIISFVSIITMYYLYRKKVEVGENLHSAPIISDAKCTRTCFYLSFILFGSSSLYEIFGIPFTDVLGSLGTAWYAFGEGREATSRAIKGQLSCGDERCK